MPEYFFTRDVLGKRLYRRGKTVPGIALFLDFDGTLAAIRKDPSLCAPTRKMTGLLSALTESGHILLTVISGRTVGDVKRRVGLPGIHYAGNHGLQIAGPLIQFTHPLARRGKADIAKAHRLLKEKISPFEGAWLEDKKYTLTLHFRNVSTVQRQNVVRTFYSVISEFSECGRLRILKGKKVLELAPVPSWNKGTAARMILNRVSENWLPVVIGDDVTDESAFSSVRGKGVTIKVGPSCTTAAEFYLKSQGEVAGVLKRIAHCF